MLISPFALAESYKYYDEQGNVHFTDDYNKVPLDQREDGQQDGHPNQPQPFPLHNA